MRAASVTYIAERKLVRDPQNVTGGQIITRPNVSVISGSTQTGRFPQYLGRLKRVNNPDINADKLAQRINGEPRVKFSNDPAGSDYW